MRFVNIPLTTQQLRKTMNYMPTHFTSVLRRLCAFIMLWATALAAIAQTETFPAGSYIINMGITPQTNSNALRPYGLIYDLLKNDKVPVKWVIGQSKGIDGVDFSFNGVDYRGGTFIIPGPHRNASVNGKISSYGVSGTTTTSPLTVNVTYTLTSAPRWTLDRQNGKIAEGFFGFANIPSSAYNFKDPQTLDGCDDIFVMPHADPKWSSHSNLYNWNRNNRGAIWAGCKAVSELENMNNGSLQTNFLSNNVGGVGNALLFSNQHDDGSPPYTRLNPSSPAAQYMGSTDAAHPGGAEQIYLPKPGGGWRSTTQVIAFDPSHPDVPARSPGPAAVIVFGRGFGLNTSGWVMYEAGHDIKKAGGTATIAAVRAFFNFSLLSSVDKVPIITNASVPTVMSNGVSYAVSITASSPVGSSFTYQWTSSCAGTFANATAASTTFTPSNVSVNTPCIITCTVTDACGRQTFSATTTNIQACNQSVTSTVTPLCVGATNTGVISINVTGGTAPYNYTWTRSGGGSGSGAGTTISGLATGTYTVTITSSTGCSNTFTATVGNYPAIVITPTPIGVSCNGGNTGSISLAVSGGTPGYTYNWGDGATTQNRSGLTAGNYSVTVTDSKSCTATANNINVPQSAVISATPTVTSVPCFGQSTGGITLAFSGGTAPYTYQWNDGASTKDRTNIPAGTYSVTITDASSCTRTVNNILVTQPSAALAATLSKTDPSCGVTNGSVTAMVSGGTAPYTYDWNGTPTGDGTATITGLSAGNYQVTVTDAKNCTVIVSITLSTAATIVLTTNITPPTCPPGSKPPFGTNGVIDLVVSGGTAPFTYAWTTSNGSGLVPTAQDQSGLSTGTYNVTVTDAAGCTASTSATLTAINPAPVQPVTINNN
jgi:SprB repeat